MGFSNIMTRPCHNIWPKNNYDMAIASRSHRPAATSYSFFAVAGLGWPRHDSFSRCRAQLGPRHISFAGRSAGTDPPGSQEYQGITRIYKHFHDSCVPPCIPRQSGHLAGLPCHIFLFAAPDAAGHVIISSSRGPGSAGHVIISFRSQIL